MTTLTRNTEALRKEVAAHIEADALIRGQYWGDGKGCFIGCLTHSDDPAPAFERFGLPVAVLRIAESIFEALSDADGRVFFATLPDAVERDGKDLSRVHWAFLAAELRALPPVSQGVQDVIEPVIAGMDALASGGDWPLHAADAADAARAANAAARAAYAARAAAYAADAAARAAYAAADAAAHAAYAADAAADAAYAADAATYAAYAATYAADAADAAAYAARLRQRDTLLRLIKEAE